MDPISFTDTWTRQDRAIATALRRAYDRLGASSCTAYLLTEDRQTLAAAMTVDTSLSFAIPPSFDVNNPTWPGPKSYQTGRAVVFSEKETQEGFLKCSEVPPSLHTTGLVPTALVSAPIRTPRHRYGVIGLRWIPPKPISAQDVDFLQGVADGLAVELEDLDGSDGAVAAPMVPVFIPSWSQSPRGDTAIYQGQVQEVVATATVRSGFLYQLQRLAIELAAAVRTEDVLAIAQARVVRPFGGQAVAMCFIEGERLHVAGAAGLPREVVRHLEGTPLSRHTPATDTINSAQARIFPSADALEQEYPHIDITPDRRAIGYFPMIRSGRAVGCCVVEFAESGQPLSPVDSTLLAIMLEQVGQSLGRTRSYEVEHALARSIQRSLLPRSFPHIPELVTTARYFCITKGVDVGGDWYDVLTLPDGRIGLVIGDVEGHNIEAAAVMGQLRSAVRAYATAGHGPAAVLELSNRSLMGLDTNLYATCCCVWLDVVVGVAVVASAGHPAPLVSNGLGHVIQPDLPIKPPLGVEAQATYQEHTLQLDPGSVTALFTDGLLDSRHLGRDVALQRLGRLLADGCEEDLEVLADRIVSDSRARQGFDDDAALVLARYEGGQSPDTARVARMSVQRDDLCGVAEVRHFLEDVLQRWSLVSVLDDIQVMASEVVTNALIHAHSAVDLRLRGYPDRIRVEVQDSDANPPVPTTLLEDEASNEEAECGRGLLIVGALALAWGSSPVGRGKITWFEIGISKAEGQSQNQLLPTNP